MMIVLIQDPGPIGESAALERSLFLRSILAFGLLE